MAHDPCEELRERVAAEIDLAVVRPEDRRHLEGCAACAAWHADLLALRAALAATPLPELPPGFEARLVAAIEAADPSAARPGLAERARRLLARLARPAPALGLAAAGALLAVRAAGGPAPARLHVEFRGLRPDTPLELAVSAPPGVRLAGVDGPAATWEQPPEGGLDLELVVEEGRGGAVRIEARQDGRRAELVVLARPGTATSAWARTLGRTPTVLEPVSDPGGPHPSQPEENEEDAMRTLARATRTLTVVAALTAAVPAAAVEADTPDHPVPGGMHAGGADGAGAQADGASEAAGDGGGSGGMERAGEPMLRAHGLVEHAGDGEGSGGMEQSVEPMLHAHGLMEHAGGMEAEEPAEEGEAGAHPLLERFGPGSLDVEPLGMGEAHGEMHREMHGDEEACGGAEGMDEGGMHGGMHGHDDDGGGGMHGGGMHGDGDGEGHGGMGSGGGH